MLRNVIEVLGFWPVLVNTIMNLQVSSVYMFVPLKHSLKFMGLSKKVVPVPKHHVVKVCRNTFLT